MDVAASMLARFKDVDGIVLVGYIAYRLFLILVPLAAIVVAAAGFSRSGSEHTAEHLHLGKAVVESLREAGGDVESSRWPLLLSGLFGFVVATWGLLGGLQIAAARLWLIPTTKFQSKAKAFVRLCGSLLLFGLVIYLSALVRRLGVVAGFAGSLGNFASLAVAFFGLGWMLPRRCWQWYWLLPGAAVGAAGALCLQLLATFYLPERLADASATYGAFGLTLTVMTYLFFLSLVFVLAMAANVAVHERYRDDPPGLLRRAAAMVPSMEPKLGSGYVAEGEAAEVVAGPAGGQG